MEHITCRLYQIAQDLREEGAFEDAKCVEAGATDRDALLVMLQKALFELEYAAEHMGTDRSITRAAVIAGTKATLVAVQRNT